MEASAAVIKRKERRDLWDMMSPLDKAKEIFWVGFGPTFPFWRDLWLRMGWFSHSGRQPWLLGKIHPHKDPKDLKRHLESRGFHDYFVALVDEGQIATMRKRDEFRYQYHVRIFNNGEVRAHHELSPEYRPFAHLRGEEMSPRKEYFIALLEEWILPEEDKEGKN